MLYILIPVQNKTSGVNNVVLEKIPVYANGTISFIHSRPIHKIGMAREVINCL